MPRFAPEHMVTMRRERGLTQQRLSAQTGLSQVAISKIERGDVNPRASTLCRIATAFGCHIDELFMEV